MANNLAELRLKSKRSAARRLLRQRRGVSWTRKPRKPKEPKTPLQALFMRRVREEMTRRKISENGLAAYGVKQRTLNDMMNGTDPRLQTVYAIAKAFGMEAHELLTEAAADNRQPAQSAIAQFPKKRSMFGRPDKLAANKARDRNKTRG